MDVCVGLVLLLAVLMIVVAFFMGDPAKEARKAYYASLERLKRDPANPDRREEALLLGRRYIAILNSFRNTTASAATYSEVSLMNDINAACARANVASVAPLAQVAQPTPPTVEERLCQLGELRSKNLITEQEYLTRRTQIINDT